MEHFKKQDRLKNEDWRKLHYEEKSDKFILYLKSQEYWEYFTTISIKKIIEFGGQYEVSREEAIKDFKTNFLSGAMPVKTEEEVVEDLPEEVKEDLQKALQPFEDEEAEDYADFLRLEFNKWEKRIFSFIDETLGDVVLEKSFGEFMTGLFNSVNTVGFRAKLKAVIKKVFVGGIEEAELEVDVDVGFDEDFEKDVDSSVERQMEGFFIGNKPWSGIKGVSQDVQRQIRETVTKGIESKESLKQIKDNIREEFVKLGGGEREDGSISEGRAMKIARTESSRMRGASKLKTYQKSGLIGKKRWNAFKDNRTSDVCKRLDKQTVPLDKPFIDPATGDEFMHNPAHVNCRSIIEFILD